MSSDESHEQPLAVTVALLLFALLGTIGAVGLLRNPTSTNNWINTICLVVAVGVWLKQDWARWLGMTWAVLAFMGKATSLRITGDDTPRLIFGLSLCGVFLFMLVVLYKNPASSPPGPFESTDS